MSGRIVVAMSGGVDSSVAAALLVNLGCDVIGMMLRIWGEQVGDRSESHNRCCTPDQISDARRVAELLGIPFYVVDARKYFHRRVVSYFLDEHAAGRTPNPCIECNREVRFSYLLEQALTLDADFLATGHYARKREAPDGYQLLKAADLMKDQSYVLHVLGQRELAKVLFPIGEYTKKQVRQLATHYGLPVASKSESMDLCFLSDGNYRRFVAKHRPQSIRPGLIASVSGETLGQHAGLPYYTIGQRKGLGIATGQPMFVVDKDSVTNRLIVGTREELGRVEATVEGVNWVSGRKLNSPRRVQTKIRYRARSTPSIVSPLDGNKVQVRFDEPVFGLSPGQGAVFYEGEACLGGGIIE